MPSPNLGTCCLSGCTLCLVWGRPPTLYVCLYPGCDVQATTVAEYEAHILCMHTSGIAHAAGPLSIVNNHVPYGASQRTSTTPSWSSKLDPRSTSQTFYLSTSCLEPIPDIPSTTAVVQSTIVADEALSLKERYPCPMSICNDTFSRRADADRHAKKHKERTLRCHAVGCGRAFYRRDKLASHRNSRGH